MRRLRDEESAVGLGVVRHRLLPGMQRRSQVRFITCMSASLAEILRDGKKMAKMNRPRKESREKARDDYSFCSRISHIFRWKRSKRGWHVSLIKPAHDMMCFGETASKFMLLHLPIGICNAQLYHVFTYSWIVHAIPFSFWFSLLSSFPKHNTTLCYTTKDPSECTSRSSDQLPWTRGRTSSSS